ncbi:MAG: phage major capsid protein [Bacteroidales bacterium]|nr:phage major capsid protein [Bacteroidales bacterium]
MSKLQDLKAQRTALYAEFKSQQEQYDGKQMPSEVRAAWDKMHAELNELDVQIDSEERRMAGEKMAVQSTIQQEERKADSKSEMVAFRNYLLGVEDPSIAKRALNGTNGGVLVPTSIADRIEKALGGISGFYSAVDVKTTTSPGNLTVPTFNGAGRRAMPVAEYAQSTRQGLTFDEVTLGAHTLRTDIIPISYELLQDSAFDIEKEIADILVEYLSAGLNYEMTNGTGDKTAMGIVKSATVVSKAGAGITYDDLVNQRKQVKAGYARNASYMMSTATECDLMLLKDGDDRPLWLPSMREGAPATLFGRPVIINDDMADGEVIFGDLKAYKARMVKGFSVIVDKSILIDHLSVALIGYCRMDGRLVNADANPVTILK